MSLETPPIKPSATVYELLWKCAYCSTDKLLGKSQRYCPNCGAPQNPESRYFPNEAEALAVQKYTYAGADLVCSACGGANAGNSAFCTQCGAPLRAAVQVKLKTDSSAPTPSSKAQKKTPVVLIALAAIAVLASGIFGLDYFWRKDVSLRLASAEWQREIKIEQFQELRQSAWCDAMPADAYRVSSSPEIRSYRKIPNGESCSTERVDQGDGTYTTREHCLTSYRSEPVYDRKCHFSVNRWRYSRSLTASGSDRTPHYPLLNLALTGDCLGCEREQQRVAIYYANLTAETEKAETYRCQISEARWRQTAPGSKWLMRAGILSDKTHCDTLAPASR